MRLSAFILLSAALHSHPNIVSVTYFDCFVYSHTVKKLQPIDTSACCLARIQFAAIAVLVAPFFVLMVQTMVLDYNRFLFTTISEWESIQFHFWMERTQNAFVFVGIKYAMLILIWNYLRHTVWSWLWFLKEAEKLKQFHICRFIFFQRRYFPQNLVELNKQIAGKYAFYTVDVSM